MTNADKPALDRRSFLLAGSGLAGSLFLPQMFGVSLAHAAGSTLVVAAPGTPQSLDDEFDGGLGTVDSISQLYDNLIEFAKIPDPDAPGAMREDTADYPDKPGGINAVGKLAESFEVDPGWTWARFKLRKGVKSNWGNELTADDVKWTWERKLACGAIGGFFAGQLGMTRNDNVQVEDPYTVLFKLDNPNPILVKLQLNLFNNIYDSKKCKEMTTAADPWARDFIASNSAGFGPYTVKSYKRGQQIVFQAREDYYRGKPAIETIIYKEVPTSAARVSLLQGGAVDIAQFLQPLEVTQLKSVPGVVVETVKASPMIWIYLNAAIKPFDQIAVRQALNYALPREQILKSVFQDTANPMTSCMPYIYAGFTDEYSTYSYDPDKARQLLKDAGVEAGFKTTLAYNAGDPVQEPISILFQTALREIGVEIELKKLPSGTFYNEVSSRKQPMIFHTDAAWCPDPGYAMSLYFESSTFNDFGNYKSEEVDKLVAEASKTADMVARAKMMNRIQQIVMTEAPWVFVAYTNYTLARRADLKGFTYYTSNHLNFSDFSRA